MLPFLHPVLGRHLDLLYSRVGRSNGLFFPNGWGNLRIINQKDDMNMLAQWPPEPIKVNSMSYKGSIAHRKRRLKKPYFSQGGMLQEKAGTEFSALMLSSSFCKVHGSLRNCDPDCARSNSAYVSAKTVQRVLCILLTETAPGMPILILT